MAKKQLQVVVTGVDQLSAPMRQMVNAIGHMGNETERSARKSENAFGRILRHMTSLTGIVQGLVAGYALRGLVREFNETAESLEQIDRVAVQTGASIESLSEWRFIARRNNLDFETFAKGMMKAQERMSELARTGGGPAREAMQRLNLSFRDGAEGVRSIEELLPEIVEQLGKVPDAAERIDLAGQLFGGSGEEFLTLVNRGSEALETLRQRARALGLVYSPEQVEMARRYQNAMRDLGDVWLRLKVAVLEQVGPFIADIVEQAARAASIVPKAIGTLFDNIRTAMYDTSGKGDAARKLFGDFFDSFARLSGNVLVYGGGVALVSAMNMIRSFLAALAPEFKFQVVNWLGQNIMESWRLLPVIMEKNFESMRVMSPKQMALADKYLKFFSVDAADDLDGFIKGAQQAWTPLARSMTGAVDAMGMYKANVSDLGVLTTAMNAAMFTGRKEIEASGMELLKSAEAILEWSKAWAQAGVDVSGVVTAVQRMKENTGPLQERTFLSGMAAAAADLQLEMGRVFEQGRDYYLGVTNAVVGSLSPALVNAAGDVKNLGRHMREFASNALRQIADITTRMLLFRAIAGIGNSLLNPAAAAGSAVPSVGGLETIGGSGLFANSGGFITRTGVRRYAGGGFVPGPNVNRDVVPALLTPGEFVLNRSATARAGVGNLARFNRGGMVGGGGGDGVSVSVVNNITINAPTGQAQEIARAVEQAISRQSPEAWLAKVNGNPGFRDRVRAAL